MADEALGIAHLAIVHYEKVLESIKIRMNEADDPEVRHVSCFLIQLDTII
jgi:catabolite regulation protein CreA